MSNCGCNKICTDSENFVDISGLCDPNDVKDLSTNTYWTQISIPTVFTIPDQKPDIEELNSENISVQIVKKKVIVTPTPPGTWPAAFNLEGKALTGRKLVIEGLICKAISYTARDDEQSVHSAHATIPFSAYIILPRLIAGTDPLYLNFEVISCIEDVFVKEICSRKIFQNVTLFLQAIQAKGGSCDEQGCSCFENVLIRGVATTEELESILISDVVPTNTPDFTNDMWTQLVVSENLLIPEKKPDIEAINSLVSSVEIISQRIVKTPPGPLTKAGPFPENLEGTKLTGKKLIIEGVLRQKITYTAEVDDCSQPVHAVHFDVPFSAFIVIDPTIVGTTVFKVKPYIEDIFVCSVSKREIFKNSIIFIKATKCV